MKGVYTSKFKSLHTALLHNIKLSGYRMGVKWEILDKYPLAAKK